MSEATINPGAVDAALESVSGKSADVVPVPAAELVRLRQQASQYEAVEKSTAGFVITSEINAAIAARTDLVEGSAAHVARLAREGLEAVRTADGWTVKTRDGKTVAEHIRACLSDPGNLMFLKPTTFGGPNISGASRTTPTIMPGMNRPRSLGEAMLQHDIARGAGVGPMHSKYRRN